ncbi:MAG: hypothetical protein HY858_10885 [Candidatus Solibacter usitatus]|nr:hypothetical protein [Candidatus Solibacter usitatus]
MPRVQLPPLTLEVWESGFARALSACWALFWTWFGFASGVAASASLLDVLAQSAPGLVFLAVVSLAWWKPHTGGAILLALGIVVFALYWNLISLQPTGDGLAAGSMLALPPMLAGALFLMAPGRRDAH